VIVVGGGVIGCAVAWSLVRRGADVTVVERGVPGAEATAAAAGMLSPLGEARHSAALLELAVASLDLYPSWVERIRDRTGIDVEFRADGRLHVALTAAGEAEAMKLAAQGERFGARTITGEDARALEPALSSAVRCGLFIPGDARVDPRLLGHAVWHAAEADGVRFRLGSPVQNITIDAAHARVQGIGLADGSRLDSETVVIAAGAWSAQIAGPPRRVPVRPVRGQMFAVVASPTRSQTRGGWPLPASTEPPSRPLVSRMVQGPGCYVIPRETGRIVVGATVEDVGFASGPTPAGIAEMLAAAVEILPGIADSPLVETWAGFRPGTPDGLPILGSDPDVHGLWWATGHYRNGILLGPITGEILAALISGEPAASIEPFRIDRFLGTAIEPGRGTH
jgi:glycine oxidase